MDDHKQLLEKVIETDKQVITGPDNFYQSMPISGGYTFPIIFVICMLLVGMVISFILSMVFGGISWEGGFGAVLVGLILIPVFGVIGSFIGAFIMHLIWQYIMDSTQEFEASYRSVAFAYGIFPVAAVLNQIPYLGTIIYTAWFFWLMLFASQHVHKIDYQKAFKILGIIFGIMVLLSLLTECSSRKAQQYVDQYAEQAKKYEQQLKDATPSEALETMAEMMRELEQTEAFEKIKNLETNQANQANILDTITAADLTTLKPTGSIEPSPEQKLILDVNESSIYAETKGATSTFENDKGYWHKLELDTPYYSEFKSINRNCGKNSPDYQNNTDSVSAVRADSEAISEEPPMPFNTNCLQMTKLSTAMIYAYDDGGNPVRGIECGEAMLLFGDELGQGDTTLWLFCPQRNYQKIQ